MAYYVIFYGLIDQTYYTRDVWLHKTRYYNIHIIVYIDTIFFFGDGFTILYFKFHAHRARILHATDVHVTSYTTIILFYGERALKYEKKKKQNLSEICKKLLIVKYHKL